MNRSRHEIMVSMLRIARTDMGVRKTRLVYKANLNFGIIKDYLQELIGKQLLSQTGSFYRTTEKGIEFMERYREMLEVIA